jgi:F-type H+-transporting ATPase subunit delta
VVRRVVSGVSDEALNLVLLMVRRGRPGAIGAMVQHFGSLLRRHRGVALAEIRTALPLEDAQREAVTERLREITGQTIEIDEVVDESLIGGITVRIGDRLYDASVRNRLERLRARLTAV